MAVVTRAARRPRMLLALAIGLALLVALMAVLGLPRTSVRAEAPRGGAACLARFGEGDSQLRLTAARRGRLVVLHVPAAIGASAEAPRLVVVLHGYASSARQFAADAGLSDRADASGVVIAYPQGLGTPAGWHFTGSPSDPVARQADIALFDALVDLLIDAGCANPARVFVAGHSQGGGMASELACRRADRIAGIAIVSGEVFSLPCFPSRPVAVMTLHAVDDEVLPYEGGKVANMAADFPRVVGAEELAAAWASIDGCLPGPRQSGVGDGDVPIGAGAGDAVPDGVLRFEWDGCAAPVSFYRFPSGGHAWSGGANVSGVGLSQSALVWSFLFPGSASTVPAHGSTQ